MAASPVVTETSSLPSATDDQGGETSAFFLICTECMEASFGAVIRFHEERPMAAALVCLGCELTADLSFGFLEQRPKRSH